MVDSGKSLQLANGILVASPIRPDRKYVNSAFIAMAIYAGLTCPITNPLVPEVAITVMGADLSMGRDEYSMNWIKAFRRREKEGGRKSA